jgi:hypothetical protein
VETLNGLFQAEVMNLHRTVRALGLGQGGRMLRDGGRCDSSSVAAWVNTSFAYLYRARRKEQLSTDRRAVFAAQGAYLLRQHALSASLGSASSILCAGVTSPPDPQSSGAHRSPQAQLLVEKQELFICAKKEPE